MSECSVCIIAKRKEKSSVRPGYLWHGGQEGDYEPCYHCSGTGEEPVLPEDQYQVRVNGQDRSLSSLSREELVTEVINLIDRFEEIDKMHSELGHIIMSFRRGY